MTSKTHNIFVSYAHNDNKWDDENVHKLIDSLRNALKVISRNKFLFFIDVEQTEWGEIWRKVIEKNLNEATFMVAFMSPSYFGSSECYKEWMQFRSLEKSYNVSNLILPIYYRKDVEFDQYISSEHDVVDSNPMLGDLAQRQFYDMRGMHPFSVENPKSKSTIEELAGRIERRSSQVSLVFEDSFTSVARSKPISPEDLKGKLDPKVEVSIVSKFHSLTNTQKIILKTAYERPLGGEITIDSLKGMVLIEDFSDMSDDEFFYRVKDLAHQELLELTSTGVKRTSVCIIKDVQIAMHRNKLIKS
ncbi:MULTISPECIES: toll/interleukin-1 receptor domain-containing protein [Asticcacaulis]|uniref:toll/interleukin-1 receptor domain-containing protein n=1 Tax=Asticcacaulis TaxID=76890 RepID=UPI001AE2DAA3|nr:MULTISPECIES: toll/interleukin-1 receptor domain-containing protein [Asticcacaulis]MBP2160359.1 hypothetical protein [Asticcacaulis solisilvae]MDR6801338.1 hypothetical protein [Asticcacaulis sp. BE141]